MILKVIRVKLVLSVLLIFPTNLLFAAEDPNLIDVTSFGAIPNDEVDDTEAIQNAIDACHLASQWQSYQGTPYLPVKSLVFPAGVFYVKTLVAKAGYINIRGSGMRSTIIKQRTTDPGPVIKLIGADYVNINNLGIHGSSLATHGVLAEDVGYDPVAMGDLAAVRGVLESVEIAYVTGTPGIGFANTDRSHSWEWNRIIVARNNIGMKLIKRVQNSRITNSSIYLNRDQQLILGGDGGSTIRGLTIRDSNIEGTETGTTELIRVDGVDPLNLDSVYFEGHRNVSATDILTVNRPSNINITGTYSNGGGVRKPDASIKLATETRLTLMSSTYINTNNVLKIVPAQGDPSLAKPELSRVTMVDVRGPNVGSTLSLNQGGQSWDHGVNLTNGANTWSFVTDNSGILWLGRNKKAVAIIKPGEIKTNF